MWISSGCYNRHPKSVLAGPRLLCSLRGQILPCLSVSGSPRGSLACGSRAPVCLHLHVASFLWVCMSLCLHMVLSLHFMSNFPLLIRMRSYQIKVYSYDLLGTWLNLQRPYFQIRSNLWYQALKLEHVFWDRGHSLSHNINSSWSYMDEHVLNLHGLKIFLQIINCGA